MAEPVPALLTVEEAARLLRVGRTKAYAMTQEWRASGGAAGLPVVDFGNVLRVPRHAIEGLIGAPLADAALAAPPSSTEHAPAIAIDAPAGAERSKEPAQRCRGGTSVHRTWQATPRRAGSASRSVRRVAMARADEPGRDEAPQAREPRRPSDVPGGPHAENPSPEIRTRQRPNTEPEDRRRHWHPAVPGSGAAVPAARRLVRGGRC